MVRTTRCTLLTIIALSLAFVAQARNPSRESRAGGGERYQSRIGHATDADNQPSGGVDSAGGCGANPLGPLSGASDHQTVRDEGAADSL